MENGGVEANFLAYAARRMKMSQGDIRRCAEQLSEEQMWQRGGEHENSVINLLLHLAGNIRQWVLHGIDGQPDVRERDEEFTLAKTLDAAEARRQFDGTVDEAVEVIAGLAPGRLAEVIDPQPTGGYRDPTILEAIFKVVGHLEMHTGQIILLTKQMVGKDLDLSLPRKR
ncbi:MAG: DUF1572 domain-containing protein [Acidobacteriota bacterium]|nr:DUF1572 domain-containing protein [Acidobacteriota bacterium]